MKKALLPIYQKYLTDCGIDTRTLSMIVHHYVSIGEQSAATLTTEKINKIYEKSVAEQAAAEGRRGPGKVTISVITPEFQRYILVACQQLYLLPADVKYAIIKENI